MSPESTSPVPAVASAALPPGLTATGPPGCATIVSSPFSSTTAPLRSAASRRALAAAGAPRPRDPARAGAPSSAACGVSTVGPARSRNSSRRPAWAFRPSASTSSGAGRPRAPRGGRTPPAPALRPRPGPSTTAPARSGHLGQLARPLGSVRALRVGQPPRHLLEQAQLHHLLHRRGHRHLHVSGAGSLRGASRHRRRAGEPGRAAGHHHHARVELGSAAQPARIEVEHALRDEAGAQRLRRSRGESRCPRPPRRRRGSCPAPRGARPSIRGRSR